MEATPLIRSSYPWPTLPRNRPPLFNKETDWHGFVLDSNCIAWMFQMSMDAGVIMAIMRVIPEVV